jgi:hypothetical protein
MQVTKFGLFIKKKKAFWYCIFYFFVKVFFYKTMTDKLPPNLLKLFAPRPPLSYTPPLDKDPEKRVGCIVDGIASFVSQLKEHDTDYVPWKSLEEKRKEKVIINFNLIFSFACVFN